VTIPAAPLPVPGIVRHIAAGRPVQPVWVNGLGGVAFQVGSNDDCEFVKVCPPNLAGEARRLRWAAQHVPVPQVLGVDDDGAWLHTRGLGPNSAGGPATRLAPSGVGLSAVHPRWLARPAAAVRAIGAGLRMLHDRLPVTSCPFDWSVSLRLARLPPERRDQLGEPPPIDKLVVCQGDPCAPNTLIGDDGCCCGHVDMGDLGVADRWADLAVATLSLQWNYPGRSWDDEFFAAYGVMPDPLRIDYYRRLWRAEDDDPGR
jgi:kanamycin kinase